MLSSIHAVKWNPPLHFKSLNKPVHYFLQLKPQMDTVSPFRPPTEREVKENG